MDIRESSQTLDTAKHFFFLNQNLINTNEKIKQNVQIQDTKKSMCLSLPDTICKKGVEGHTQKILLIIPTKL